MEKAKNEGKKKEKKGKWEIKRRDREIERRYRESETHSPTPWPRHPHPCRVAVTLARVRPILILLPSTHANKTHLPPSPVAWNSLATVAHRYLLLSFPSKPNKYKMFVIWSENLRFTKTMLMPCGLVVFHVCVIWTDVGDWLIVNWIYASCGVFFFFGLAFWLCDSVTLCLCLWLSILYYIDKRDRERESRVCSCRD